MHVRMTRFFSLSSPSVGIICTREGTRKKKLHIFGSQEKCDAEGKEVPTLLMRKRKKGITAPCPFTCFLTFTPPLPPYPTTYTTTTLSPYLTYPWADIACFIFFFFLFSPGTDRACPNPYHIRIISTIHRRRVWVG
ncbi:hypothetical protein QBC40DRAFT_28834 [Triangularia verruculosa]|uniref:Uncharacterized protein n=1 Tax=Triangularia verruculosa TaxID=2587418 RepID=A0AAN6X698_9PEZI|nr:hypothetical protein QBC40DRAFT_28834 [Triangularia verruculosa]